MFLHDRLQMLHLPQNIRRDFHLNLHHYSSSSIKHLHLQGLQVRREILPALLFTICNIQQLPNRVIRQIRMLCSGPKLGWGQAGLWSWSQHLGLKTYQRLASVSSGNLNISSWPRLGWWSQSLSLGRWIGLISSINVSCPSLVTGHLLSLIYRSETWSLLHYVWWIITCILGICYKHICATETVPPSVTLNLCFPAYLLIFSTSTVPEWKGVWLAKKSSFNVWKISYERPLQIQSNRWWAQKKSIEKT